MKKFGFLVFIAAIVFGIIVSSVFSFGRISPKFFNISFNKKVKGSGNTATEEREVKGFTGVDVSGVFQVEIVAQKEFGVEIQADDNLLPLIRTEVRNGILHIETEKSISSQNGMKVMISAPDIDSLEASGAAHINLSGVKNDKLRIDTSGASKINLSGETAKLEIEVSGASGIEAENLKADKANVDASGASHVSVFAATELLAEASGASSVTYSGSPKSVRKNTSGVSSIHAN